jgi:hypothetical protein
VLAFAFIALLFLALAGCTIGGAPPGKGSAESKVTSSWTDAAQNWQATTILLVFTIILLLGIGYMVAESFNSRELKAWVITEFYQAAFSLVLVFMLIVLFAAISQISSSLASTVTQGSSQFGCAASECQFDIASQYLLNVRDKAALPLAHEELQSAVKEIGASTFKISLVTVDLVTLFSGGSVRPYAGRSIIADRHMLLFDYTTRIAASLTAQGCFLSILQGHDAGASAPPAGSFDTCSNPGPGLVPLFLIAGVVLRSVFFMRRLGGLMIAIAIALFTVYPLMYLLAWSTLPINIVVSGTQIGGLPSDGTGANLVFTYPQETALACVAFYGTPANPAWNTLHNADPQSFDNRGPQYCTDSCSSNANPTQCYQDCLSGTWVDSKYMCANLETSAGFVCHSDVLAKMALDNACKNEHPGTAKFAECYKTYASAYLTANGITNCYYLKTSSASTDPYNLQCTFTSPQDGSTTTCPATAEPGMDLRVIYGGSKANGQPWDYRADMWPALASRYGDAMAKAGINADNMKAACYTCADAGALRTVPSPAQSDGLTGGSSSMDFGAADDPNSFNLKGDVEGVGLLVVVAVILPMMNFIFTITFVKILSPLLGGDMDIEGLMKLI